MHPSRTLVLSALLAAVVAITDGGAPDAPPARAAANGQPGVSMATRISVYSPGEQVVASIENRLPKVVIFGPGYEIQVFRDGRWALAPESPRGPWTKILQKVRPGKTFVCCRFDVSAQMAPGSYRLVKVLHVVRDSKQTVRTKKIVRRAPFEISPSS